MYGMDAIQLVLSLILSHFCEESGSSFEEFSSAMASLQSVPSREDRKLSRVIINLLKDHVERNVEIIEGEELFFESEELDEELDPLEDDALYEEDANIEHTAALIAFSNNQSVKLDRAREALTFYRSSKKGNRSLTSMTSNYRFIKTKHDISKLIQLERSESTTIDRRKQIKHLCTVLRDEVLRKMDSGIPLHDSDLQSMARKINDEVKIERRP